MSYQGSAWFKHTRHFLDGIDSHLGKMFEEAMRRAGLPQVSEATAFEAILADFLSGPGDTLYAASMLPHIMRHLKLEEIAHLEREQAEDRAAIQHFVGKHHCRQCEIEHAAAIARAQEGKE